MRWRYVKQNKIPRNTKETKKPAATNLQCVNILTRFKAFLIDMFMIHIPILYFVAYVLMSGKDDFQSNQIAILSCTMLFGAILSLFFSIKGQSPGYKAYDIKLIDEKTGNNTTFLKAFFRFLSFLFSCASVIGIAIMFFRKDRKAFHDILSKTLPVAKC